MLILADIPTPVNPTDDPAPEPAPFAPSVPYTPADDAEHAAWNADEPEPDWDALAGEAAALDAYERGLVFA
jgi:hypothetical protein